jgi:perosamine synthetase
MTDMAAIQIPVYRPLLDGNERKYVYDCLDSGWISSKGKYVELFENAFSNYIGSKHALGVCNGTAAIHLSLCALGLRPGDEVIVPTFTYVASVNAVRMVGATPIFADSLPDTWQIDPDDVRRKITSRTRAIMAVHLYGLTCDMGRLAALAATHDIFLVEDAAEALGSEWQGVKAGCFGDIAAFSFFGNKTITTGEGGMVACRDPALHERALHLRGQGLAKYREYWHDVMGYNYRMTNIAAAIGLAQLENVEAKLERKRILAEQYQQLLKDLPLSHHCEIPPARHSYWMCSILLESEQVRDELRIYLAESGIETRPLFPAVHTMPIYAERYRHFPVAENLGRRGMNLPSFPALRDDEQEYICNQIRNFFT